MSKVIQVIVQVIYVVLLVVIGFELGGVIQDMLVSMFNIQEYQVTSWRKGSASTGKNTAVIGFIVSWVFVALIHWLVGDKVFKKI